MARRPLRRSIRILWISFLIFFLGMNLLVLACYFNWFNWFEMPPIAELENPSSAVSSEVYAADGTMLGRYFVQDRSNSRYDEISPNVINALIATEDERFFDHSGVDGKALMRAVSSMGRDGGGSTITQQLALNLFNGKRARNKVKRAGQKFKEMILAVKLERNLTKNEIITLYLNTVPFGDNVYGIKNASLTFFSKQPKLLTVDEAAMLVGMLKGNSLYSPRRHPDRALNRRNTVIEQMVKYDKLTAGDAVKYKARPLGLKYHKIDYSEGVAPYFRQVVEMEVKKVCKDLKKPDGTNYNIYKDGLKIYTTIDMRMQRYAEAAMEQHMSEVQKQFSNQSGSYRSGSVWKGHDDVVIRAMKNSDRYADLKEEGMSDADIRKEFEKPVKMTVFAWNTKHSKDTTMSPWDSIKYTRLFLQSGFAAMDPFTGEVKAWVGGVNHEYFKFDHVNERAKRQVGSTIKPLLYCLAINESGISPCDAISTGPIRWAGKSYNAGGSKFGAMTLKKALAASVNNAALNLVMRVGVTRFKEWLKECGITSTIPEVPSAALGVPDISLFEMLGAYTMFPTGGIQTKPIFITKIEDKNGVLIKSFVPERKEIINAQRAFQMVTMMKGVVDFGTAKRLRFRYGIKSELAGKTGTTNKQADAWFIGYSPQLLAGAWVGCDDPFLHFQSEGLGQGAAAALPVWAYFFKKVYADKSLGIDPDAKFVEPADFNECDVRDPNSAFRADYDYGSRGVGNGSSNNNDDDDVFKVNDDGDGDWGDYGVGDDDGGSTGNSGSGTTGSGTNKGSTAPKANNSKGSTAPSKGSKTREGKEEDETGGTGNDEW